MERFSERQLLLPLSELTNGLPETIAELEQQAVGRLLAEGLEAEKIMTQAGLASPHRTGVGGKDRVPGWDRSDRSVSRSIRVTVWLLAGKQIDRSGLSPCHCLDGTAAHPTREHSMFKRAANNEPIIRRKSLTDGSRIDGPSIIQDRFCTISIGEHWQGILGSNGTIKLERITTGKSTTDRNHSPIVELELLPIDLTRSLRRWGRCYSEPPCPQT